MSEGKDKATGRPSEFTQDMADFICDKIMDGKSLRFICEKMEGTPCKTTVLKWLNQYPDFATQYARARDEQADTYADDIMDVSDNVGNPLLVDGLPVLDKDGRPVMIVDAASVAHAKLKADSRKWVASKLKPKKYGDKIEHSGSMTMNISDEALDARLSAILNQPKPE